MRDAFAEIERARSALWFLDAGTDRDTWVKNAMAAKAAGLDFDTWHEWCSSAPNYHNEQDCRSVWQSIRPGPVGEGSLFHAARAAGWTDDGEPPAKRPPSRQDKSLQHETARSRRSTRSPCGAPVSRQPSSRSTSSARWGCRTGFAFIVAR